MAAKLIMRLPDCAGKPMVLSARMPTGFLSDALMAARLGQEIFAKACPTLAAGVRLASAFAQVAFCIAPDNGRYTPRMIEVLGGSRFE